MSWFAVCVTVVSLTLLRHPVIGVLCLSAWMNFFCYLRLRNLVISFHLLFRGNGISLALLLRHPVIGVLCLSAWMNLNIRTLSST